MPNYVFTYHGQPTEMPPDPAAVAAAMDEWGAWFKSLGSAVVDMGAPLGQASAVASDGSSTAAPASLTGYTIVQADDMATAEKLASGCPVLQNEHTVQINETIDMT